MHRILPFRGEHDPVDGERGQVVPMLALLLVVVLVVALLVARVGGVVTDRTRARAAADAAALAGVIDGRPGAERLALANGGELLDYTSTGSTVEVRVRVGRAEASARATAEARPSGGGADHPGRVPYTDQRVGHPADERTRGARGVAGHRTRSRSPSRESVRPAIPTRAGR